MIVATGFADKEIGYMFHGTEPREYSTTALCRRGCHEKDEK